jgi:hypothetical protein
MDISRKFRMELNELSKEVFGVSSKWQTILRKGTSQLVTRKVTEIVPGKEGEEPTTKEVDQPVLTPYGAKQFVQKYPTLEELHETMLTYKAQLEIIREQMKQQQEEKAAKEAEEKAIKDVKEAAQGTAITT